MVESKHTADKIDLVLSQYIEFDWVGSTGKTDIWNVLSKSSEYILGQIKWYGAWRQYCFWPSPQTIFSSRCMQDINQAVKQLMEDRRKKPKE